MSGAATFKAQNAEAYEQQVGRWSRRLAPLLIRFGGLTDGERVLDVGCGTGSLTFALPQFAQVAAVTGIDPAETYLNYARARNTDRRISFQRRMRAPCHFPTPHSIAPSQCWSCNSSPTPPARQPRCTASCGGAGR